MQQDTNKITTQRLDELRDLRQKNSELEALVSALKESEERFRAISNYTYDWENWVGLDGKLMWVNPAVEKLTGYSPQEYLNLPDRFNQIICDGDRDRILSHIENGLQKHQSENDVEFQIRCKDGSLKWVSVSYQPIFTGKGECLGLRSSIRDIASRKLAEQKLMESQERLAFLSSRLLVIQEEDHTRVSREVHDVITSALGAILLAQSSTARHFKNNKQEAALESNDRSIVMTQELIRESKKIISDLRPMMIDDLGLIATLSWLYREFATEYPSVSLIHQIDVEEPDIPEELKIVIFRIAQEAVTNIGKHSKAQTAILSLKKKDTCIRLRITDNGTGFDMETIRSRRSSEKGLGLISMQERAELSGGALVIESAVGKGTTIRASWQVTTAQ